MRSTKQTNLIVREELARHGLFLWQLGKLINASESTVTRLMREELPEEEQMRLVQIIRERSKSNE